MRFAGTSLVGRLACKLASMYSPPYYGRHYLAKFNKHGYISPSATIYHSDLSYENNTFIDDRVLIFQDHGSGSARVLVVAASVVSHARLGSRAL